MEQSHIINKLTFGLPDNVTRPIYLEYNSRRREHDRIWANPENNYKILQDYASTVEALLAISIFYRHVMGHMNGAVSFYKSVNHNGMGKEYAIKVGKTLLDSEQQGHLLSAVISFNQIQKKYQLEPVFFEYSETIQFLRNCKVFLSSPLNQRSRTVKKDRRVLPICKKCAPSGSIFHAKIVIDKNNEYICRDLSNSAQT